MFKIQLPFKFKVQLVQFRKRWCNLITVAPMLGEGVIPQRKLEVQSLIVGAIEAKQAEATDTY